MSGSVRDPADVWCIDGPAAGEIFSHERQYCGLGERIRMLWLCSAFYGAEYMIDDHTDDHALAVCLTEGVDQRFPFGKPK